MEIILVVIVTFIATTLFEAIVFFIQHRRYKSSFNKEQIAFKTARKIDTLLLQTEDSNSTIQKIADFLPSELDFATGVVVLFDKNKNVLRRVAASRTKEAIEAVNALTIPFNEIEIPIGESRNLMARALREKKEFVTTNVWDVFVPVLTQEEANKIQQIMSTRFTIVYPLYVQDTPLGVFIASSKKLNLNEYEKDIISVFVDGAGIALQNSLLFNNLKEANMKLKDVDKMKDEFISIASHDLRTPLSVVKDYLYLAVKESKVATDINRHLLTAQRANDEAIMLVNDMLDVSRIEAGRIDINLQTVDLGKLIQEIREEFAISAHEKKIDIDVVINQDLKVNSDKERLRQVITNFVTNALKFTPENGKVTISATRNGQMADIAVRDTGPGIKEEDMSKLFQKFGRLDNSRTGVAIAPGTGLGLYITKKLVDLLKGKITVQSEFGKGSVFSFSLRAL